MKPLGASLHRTDKDTLEPGQVLGMCQDTAPLGCPHRAGGCGLWVAVQGCVGTQRPLLPRLDTSAQQKAQEARGLERL